MEADDMNPDENDRVGILGLDEEEERADGIDEVSIDHELELEQSSIQQLLDDTDRFLNAHTPAASPDPSPGRSTRCTETASISADVAAEPVAMRSEAGDVSFEARFGVSGSEARDEHVERLLQDTNSLLQELDHTTAAALPEVAADSDEHSERHESLAAAVASAGYDPSAPEPHQRRQQQHRPTSVPLQWPCEDADDDEDTEDDALESERVKNTEKNVDELMQKMRELCSNDDKLDDQLGSVERSFSSLHSDLRRSDRHRYVEADDAFANMSERAESDIDRRKGVKQTASVAIDDEDMELRDLNRLLVRCGFGPVGLLYGPDSSGPTKSELVDSLKSVLMQFEEQGVLVQNMLSEQQQFRRERLPSAQRSSPQTPFSEGSPARYQNRDEFLDSANQSLQIRLRDAEEALRRLRRESDDEKQSNRDQLHVVQKRLRDMRQKVTQAEHQLRKKDDLYAKLQKKLDQIVRSREERRQKDAALFEKMFKRKPRTSSAKDSSTLEMLSAFETQRVRMQDEIDHLTKMLRSTSVAGLGSRGAAELELEQRVNTAASMEAAAAADSVAREELQRLKRRSKQDLAQMQEQIKILQEDRDNLRLELQARPSMKHYKDAKKQIEKLSAQLVEARNLSDLRKHLGTTELIRRDKDIHRLRLNRLDHLPNTISKEILQDVCRELGVDDVSLALPALRKVCSVVRTAPSLKRFIHEVVSLVLSEDRSEAPWDDALDRVQTKLNVWKGELHRLDELDELRRRILKTLRKRAQIVKSAHLKQQQSEGPFIEPGSELMLRSDNDIITVLDELVDCEQQVLDSSDAYAAADAAMKQQPGLLFHKIVAHFCHLFDCKETAAIFPTMNRLFLTVQEQNNFIRCVRSTLRLEDTAALNTCASALQQLTASDPDLRLAGDAPDFECVDTMHKLKQYLGCDKAIDIVDTCRKLKDRCDLYNGLFPRIDKTLQSLFELLDVKELDHIVPCVRRLVFAQR